MILILGVCLLTPTVANAHEKERPQATHVDTAAELSVSNRALTSRAKLRVLAPAGALASLPQSWCGQETGTDSLSTPGSSTAPGIKLIYAYPSDRADRFFQFANVLQGNASTISSFIAAQSGSSKTVRFDMGSSCGAGYVDLQSVALPRTRSSYTSAGTINTGALLADLQPLVATPGLRRNYLVILDTLAPAGPMGFGWLYQGGNSDTPDPSNIHNSGGLFAMVFGSDGATPNSAAPTYQPGLFMHELGHTLGAVQYSAPNSSSGGNPNSTYSHCFDEWDVMCYADGGPANSLTFSCATHAGQITEEFDCGQNDYFNPTPAPGSYLATHWNTFNSVFLVACDQADSSCGETTITAPATNPTTGTITVTATPTKPSTTTPDADVKISTSHVRPTKSALRWTNGASIGKILGRMTLTVAGYQARITGVAFRLPAGRWHTRSCVVLRSFSGKRARTCNSGRVTVQRRRRVVLPSVSTDVPASAVVSGTGSVVGHGDNHVSATAQVKN
jgi:hypothetical protein